jgi:4-amino-4-deoxy-L-arabinose transferase-like glycosyltransferase
MMRLAQRFPGSRIGSPQSLLFLYFVTVSVRLIFAWVVYPHLMGGEVKSDDWPDNYDDFALNLINGHGFALQPGVPSVMRGPVYPLLGALIFKLFGPYNLAAVQIVHALIDGLTALVVFHIGKTAFDRRVGFVAAAVFAVYPLSVWYSARMSMVSLLTLFYTATAWLVIKCYNRPSVRLSAATGGLFGVTTLTMPITTLLPLFLLAAWLIARVKPGRAIGHTLVVTLAMAVVMSPWTIRNYRVTGDFIPISLGGGYAMLFGDLWAEQHNGFTPYSKAYPTERFLQKLLNERVENILEAEGADPDFYYLDLDPATAKVLNRYAVGHVVDHPLQFAKKALIHALYFWYLGNNNIKSVGIFLIQLLVLLPWLAVGLYFCWKRRVRLSFPLVVLIVYLNGTYAATIANARHGMPAMPLAIVIAAYGFCQLWERHASKKASRL